MLKLIDTKTKESLAPEKIAFSESSEMILKSDSDPHHDRVMELGARCGDLLVNNMNPLSAQAVMERLAAEYELDEARAEALLLGARNAINIAVEQHGVGGDIEAIPTVALAASPGANDGFDRGGSVGL